MEEDLTNSTAKHGNPNQLRSRDHGLVATAEDYLTEEEASRLAGAYEGVMSRSHKFTPRAQQIYLDELIRTGAVVKSCAAAGVSYKCVRDFRLKSPEFREQVELALELHRDRLLEEATRRAVDGWDERPVVDDEGNIVGYVHKYSDRLLELLLKRADPSFRDNAGGPHTNQSAGASALAELATLSPEARDKLRSVLEEAAKALQPPDPVTNAVEVEAVSEEA